MSHTLAYTRGASELNPTPRGAVTTKEQDCHTTGSNGRLEMGAWKLAEGGWPGAWQARGKFETGDEQERGTGRARRRRAIRRVGDAWQGACLGAWQAYG